MLLQYRGDEWGLSVYAILLKQRRKFFILMFSSPIFLISRYLYLQYFWTSDRIIYSLFCKEKDQYDITYISLHTVDTYVKTGMCNFIFYKFTKWRLPFKGFCVYMCLYMCAYTHTYTNYVWYEVLHAITCFFPTKLFLNIILNDYRIVHHIYLSNNT